VIATSAACGLAIAADDDADRTLVFPGGNIHAVTKNVFVLDDDIADIDADPEHDFRCGAAFAPGHPVLHGHRAGDGIDGAGKLGQETVARGLDDASIMVGDGGIDDFTPHGLQRLQRSDFVGSHQTAIASDISRQNRRQPPLDSPNRHEAPGKLILPSGIKARGQGSCQQDRAIHLPAKRWSALLSRWKRRHRHPFSDLRRVRTATFISATPIPRC